MVRDSHDTHNFGLGKAGGHEDDFLENNMSTKSLGSSTLKLYLFIWFMFTTINNDHKIRVPTNICNPYKVTFLLLSETLNKINYTWNYFYFCVNMLRTTVLLVTILIKEQL